MHKNDRSHASSEFVRIPVFAALFFGLCPIIRFDYKWKINPACSHDEPQQTPQPHRGPMYENNSGMMIPGSFGHTPRPVPVPLDQAARGR